MVRGGELARLVREDAVTGVTSQPDDLREGHRRQRGLRRRHRRAWPARASRPPRCTSGWPSQDIREAADVLRPVYNRTRGGDGYVEPGGLAAPGPRHRRHGGRGPAAVAAVGPAQPLHQDPGDRRGPSGHPPVHRARGSTSMSRCSSAWSGTWRWSRRTWRAWRPGDRRRPAADRVASVASFFLSRIDVLVDPMLEKPAAAGRPRTGLARSRWGRWPSPRPRWRTRCTGRPSAAPRFQRLAEQGARVQRLLWASTSTKNPAYSDVKYVEPLIGRRHDQHDAPGDGGGLPRSRPPRAAAGEGRGRGVRGAGAPGRGGLRPGGRHAATGGGGHREVQQALRQPAWSRCGRRGRAHD